MHTYAYIWREVEVCRGHNGREAGILIIGEYVMLGYFGPQHSVRSSVSPGYGILKNPKP